MFKEIKKAKKDFIRQLPKITTLSLVSLMIANDPENNQESKLLNVQSKEFGIFIYNSCQKELVKRLKIK